MVVKGRAREVFKMTFPQLMPDTRRKRGGGRGMQMSAAMVGELGVFERNPQGPSRGGEEGPGL